MTKETQKEGMKKTAQDLISNLMKNSPVDHGLLKQWAITSQSDSEIHIKSPAKYAAYVNYGTRPHMIRPKSRKALHWFGGSTTISGGGVTMTGKKGAFSKGHMVRGITGKKFVERSIEATNQRIHEFFTIKG